MKKKFWITIASLAVVVIFGVVVYQLSTQQAGAQLSREEVSNMVTDLYPGEITKLQLADNAVYEVTVQTEANAYQLNVDSQSGEVLALTETKSSGSNPSAVDQNDQNQEEIERGNQEQEDTNRNENGSDQNALLSQDELNEIALNEFPGTITETELDEDDDRLIYEMEIINNEEEATIEIDAYTGEIVMLEIDRED